MFDFQQIEKSARFKMILRGIFLRNGKFTPQSRKIKDPSVLPTFVHATIID